MGKNKQNIETTRFKFIKTNGEYPSGFGIKDSLNSAKNDAIILSSTKSVLSEGNSKEGLKSIRMPGDLLPEEIIEIAEQIEGTKNKIQELLFIEIDGKKGYEVELPFPGICFYGDGGIEVDLGGDMKSHLKSTCFSVNNSGGPTKIKKIDDDISHLFLARLGEK